MVRDGRKFFRNWAQGTGKDAGAWGRDEIRNIDASVSFRGYGSAAGDQLMGTVTSASGAFSVSEKGVFAGQLNSTSVGYSQLTFSADKGIPTGPENVPPHVWQPVVLYLGRPA